MRKGEKGKRRREGGDLFAGGKGKGRRERGGIEKELK